MNAQNPVTHAFATGSGQNDTHAQTLSDGRKNPHPSAGKSYDLITGPQIAAMVQNPPSVPKDQAQWFLPSTYHEADARAHDAQRERGQFCWLALDVDENNLPLEDVAEALRAVLGACSLLVYASCSAKPADRKWRALVPLKTPLAGADYGDTQAAFFDLLEEHTCGTLICDRALERPGQLVYLPNRGQYYDCLIERATALDLTADHPIIRHREAKRHALSAAVEEARRERERRQAQREARTDADEPSPVDAFNAAHDVQTLLERYGYERAGRSDDWRSPMQTSKGSYATRCFGDYWVSLSGSDAAAEIGRQTANGNRHGDAFDLFVHFEHGGDFHAAVAAYGEEIRPASPAAFQSGPKHGNGRQEVHTSDGKQRPNEPGFRHADLDLVRDDKGRPFWNVANAITILSEHREWKGVLGYDAFAKRRVFLKQAPGETGGTYPRDVEDNDFTAVQRWFNTHGFPRAGVELVISAVRAVCRDNAYDPLANYLDSLTWDGAERLPTWLTTYCGVEADAFTDEAGLRWMISAVARALNPGCKADHMLVLEGSQGALKSTALRTLAGDEWFSDSLPPMGTKDASAHLRGKWIVEVAELAAMKREQDQIKAFVSRQTEVFREAYGREEVTEPRRCVFAGTTNKDDWHNDATGGRRFWPVKVGRIDVKAIARDRHQLWAEAVHRYRAGEKWWLTGEANKAAQQAIAERLQEDDPWTPDVMRIAGGRSEIAIGEILDRLGIDREKRTRMDSKRVSEILKSEGWNRSGQFSSGEFKGAARYMLGRVDRE